MLTTSADLARGTVRTGRRSCDRSTGARDTRRDPGSGSSYEPCDVGATGRRVPPAIQVYPKARGPITDDPTAGARNNRAQLVAHGVGTRWVLWGEATVDHEVVVWWAQSSPRSNLSSYRTNNPPTLSDRRSCPVSREAVKGARQHGDGHQSYDSSRRSGCSNPARDAGCTSLNAVPHAVLGVASLDRRILLDL
jgi:hypothetical protein